MNIHVTKEAATWYKEELQLKEPTYVRFFTRYGFGGHLPGFSLGVVEEEPQNMHTSTQVDDTIFYIEEKDSWYFENKDLTVTFNDELQEPEFIYHE
ncbi:MAG TPA: hypothetical protein VK119_07775 [Bacillota bacterium]|nr:hypothetical protein [Bacillota bacterium]